MICAQCKKKQANVHFEGVINGKSIEMELCQDCARISGITTPFSFASSVQPALTELMDLLSDWQTSSDREIMPKAACPTCHWTLTQFQKTGKMGCADCYMHFHKQAESVLKKIHGASILHKGKKAPAEAAKAKMKEKKDTLTRLRLDLEKAVREEKFELAAELRDKIRSLEQKAHDANV